MTKYKYNPFLVLVIAIGLVAALFINVMRYRDEAASRQIDLAIDYEGLLELAELEGMEPADVLRGAREAGISSLAVYETTFKKLNVNGKAAAVRGSDIIERYGSGSLVSPEWRALVESGAIVGTEVYVTGHDPQTYSEVKADIIRRLGADRVRTFTVDGHEALAVKANWKSFEKMNLGMPTDEMKAVNDAGFYVLARPSNYAAVTDDDINAVFDRMNGVRVSEMVFSGSETLGAPKKLKAVIEKLKERDITLGGIEATTQLQFYKQEGLMEMAAGYDYRLARLYAIPKDEQPKMKMEAAVERWANTDEERNIRIDLMRIYEKPAPGMSLYETNMRYFKATHDKLVSMGYTIGPAGTFYPLGVSRVLRALVVIGAVAGGVLYLSLVIPALNTRCRWQLIMWIVISAIAAAPVLMGSGMKIRLVTSLASANIFPALSVIFMLDRMKRFTDRPDWSLIKLIVISVLALFVCGALSFVGAAYLSAALSDETYFLEINIFRGIKLTFIMPLILVAIAFLQRFDIFDGAYDDTFDENTGIVSQVKRILEMRVTMGTLFVIGMLGIAAIVFIARSGHNMGMPVSSLELRFRAFLEQALYARPRSKELLIGHPAFIVAAYAWARKWPMMLLFLIVMAATIGQGSMVETFCHMRTPVMMSFARGIGGIVGGAAIGAVAVFVIGLIEKAWRNVNKKA